ncbi:23S rRNA (cytidine1920-2'-O)/16S rRNA (cytidine1409-2'-O)-methyltransferase [Paramicrobacterium humi]|uniref:23S rRNA (Cytidine1920-2'-O)/16S rRNA (Cytidine1409-2'-O)-methyltransferase n=1 Tax=Paramicrobacterium humi TaxID=640635 RepID=A0A1H4PXR0_9MICO|nr:23S rRNA (cytidine1920-2'-O)/16S rRNA (cytidine1409-2'-O)-methyltransferase [Microbacterium humi]
MTSQRLDTALARRGLARSRAAAAELIKGGLVAVDGRTVVKPAFAVAETQRIEVAGADHYVSRGAHKLIAALDAFEIPVSGREVLDIGASTGGFTQVLLERGATRVIALDVGHGQLVPELRNDRRVVVVEGFNARELSADSLAAASGIDKSPSLVVGDLSFISLRYLFGPLADTVGRSAEIVLLIKPQFEVGKTGVREGIVRDAGLRVDAVQNVLWSAWDAGFGVRGLIASPIAGTHGNREFLVHLTAEGGSNPTEWMQRAARLAGDGE